MTGWSGTPHVCAHSGLEDVARLSDDDLPDLLENQGNTLTLGAIEECASRADSILPVLTGFLRRRKLWSGADDGAFWLPVHATCVLACIGTPEDPERVDRYAEEGVRRQQANRFDIPKRR